MKEGPWQNDHSHFFLPFGDRKPLHPRIWSTWRDHQKNCAHMTPWASSQTGCLWRGRKWGISHTCVNAGLFSSLAQQYSVILSAELRSAYSSIRPLASPQQRLLFNIMTLLSYKRVLEYKLQDWVSPKLSSSYSSSDQHQQVASGSKDKLCLSYHDLYKPSKIAQPLKTCKLC